MRSTIVLSRVDADLVALARCMALGATCFPTPAVPIADQTGTFTRVIAAQDRTATDPLLGFVSLVITGGGAEIVGLAVASAHRRGGIGRALLHAAIAEMHGRGIGTLSLHVSVANVGAITLYESLGFGPTAVLRRYYAPGQFDSTGDAYEMTIRVR